MARVSPMQSDGIISLKSLSVRYLACILFGVALIFFVLSLVRPFTTDDVLIYSLIGKVIYTKGIMPFAYVFDHKPLVTYYLFGLLAIGVPDDVPKYQILSVIGYALTALVTRGFVKRDKWFIHFLLITALSIKFMRFSANTELLFAPLSMLSVFLVFRSQAVASLFFAGMIAAIAFNINYIALFSFAPAVLYVIFTLPKPLSSKFSAAGIYGIGFLFAFLLVLLPLFVKDPALVADYFGAQQKFLGHYSKSDIKFFYTFIVSAIPLAAFAFVCFRCEAENNRTRNVLLVVLVFAFIGAIAPGKFFGHYLYATVLPIVALYALSLNPRKNLAAAVVVIILAALSAPSYLIELKSWMRDKSTYDLTQFGKLKSIVGDEKVLVIRAQIQISYFSNLVPLQPLVWGDHAEQIYGPKEDDYFLGYLDQRPKFVLTLAGLCDAPQADLVLPKSCASIAANYSRVMTVEDDIGWRRGFLYKIN